MESEYMALTLGLADELFSGIQLLLATYKLRLLPSLTVYDANRLLSNQIFHLLIINLEYLKSVQQIEWLTGVRRISFAPLIVLSDAPDLDLHSMVELGADICAPSKGPHSIIRGFIPGAERSNPAILPSGHEGSGDCRTAWPKPLHGTVSKIKHPGKAAKDNGGIQKWIISIADSDSRIIAVVISYRIHLFWRHPKETLTQ